MRRKNNIVLRSSFLGGFGRGNELIVRDGRIDRGGALRRGGPSGSSGLGAAEDNIE